nr:PTS transporter subunit IIC [Escherichia coli]
MLPSETMIWQPEFTDKTLSRKPGAVQGVFGNATGGRRGAILGAFAQGLLITFLPVFLLPVLGDIGFANTTFSDADFGALGILLGIIVR